MRDSLKSLLVLSIALGGAAGSAAPVLSAPQPACGYDYTCVAPGGGSSGGDSTAAFLGLRWDLGSAGPALSGGVRYLRSDDGEQVYGAQVDASLPLTGDIHLPKLRLMGIAGTVDVQGQIGGGFDFARDTAIISGGVQGPNVEGGLDFGLDGSLAAYLGVNSLKRPEYSGGALSCPPFYTLAQVDGGVVEFHGDDVIVTDEFITNGQSCLLTPP